MPVASGAEPAELAEPVAGLFASPDEQAEVLPEASHEIAVEEPTAAGDFGFLAAEDDAPAAAAGDWPAAAEEPAAEGDKNLDDFFKGLS